MRDLDAQTHRRFIKTHTPLDGLPLHDDVTYVIVGRDPRRQVSMEHHRRNMDLDHFIELRAEVMGLDDLAELVRPGPAPTVDEQMPVFLHGSAFGSLESIVHHLDDAWTTRAMHDVVLVHYADLIADLPGRCCGSPARWDPAVRGAGPAARGPRLAPAMRARAGELAPVASHGNWRDNDAFFRSGTLGEGRAAMTADHHAAFDRPRRARRAPGRRVDRRRTDRVRRGSRALTAAQAELSHSDRSADRSVGPLVDPTRRTSGRLRN